MPASTPRGWWIMAKLLAARLSKVSSDMLALPLFKDTQPSKLFKELDEALGGLLTRVVSVGDFKGEEGESLLLYPSGIASPRILLVGLGRKDDVDLEKLRVFGGVAVQRAKELKLRKVAVALPRGLDIDPVDQLRAVAEGAMLANYVYSEKSGDMKEREVEELVFVSTALTPGGDETLREVEVVAQAYRIARDLANAPASKMNPARFEEEVRKVFSQLPVDVKVFHREELEKMGMYGIISVGKGSAVPPRLVVLEYRGGEEGSPWYGIVGKGVCFDAGGLGIKTAESMRNMKFDKSGAAYAVGIVYAAARLGLKMNLVAALPLVENLPSGSAYKPGDVIRMFNGKTVEVGHTDAEGRLIMADALAYLAQEYRPRVLVDLATLTGAIVVALGSVMAGLYTNSDDVAKAMEKAAKKTGERVWRMPLVKEYHDLIKSDVADIRNVGVVRSAGAGVAAAFLENFVEGTPWAHLDIAGVAWVKEDGPKKPYYPKGATGFGIRLVLEFLKIYSGS
ncbi:MAG: leucyl aminopeptidase [Thermoprotei archaeon]|nr:MAG: leucyl aminopeptidase [Thermoprotei archaeon]